MQNIVELKGIIFDMDNTILQSKIDFTAMKTEIYDFLLQKELITLETDFLNNTTSTLVAELKVARCIMINWTKLFGVLLQNMN